mmetsp:Transcript_39097/g.103326  ORF Transcript_39097/g.103326 Transcript_39097/m.103326 type:complete len:260 (+) Transcript_39097:1586-2365(+)
MATSFSEQAIASSYSCFAAYTRASAQRAAASPLLFPDASKDASPWFAMVSAFFVSPRSSTEWTTASSAAPSPRAKPILRHRARASSPTTCAARGRSFMSEMSAMSPSAATSNFSAACSRACSSAVLAACRAASRSSASTWAMQIQRNALVVAFLSPTLWKTARACLAASTASSIMSLRTCTFTRQRSASPSFFLSPDSRRMPTASLMVSSASGILCLSSFASAMEMSMQASPLLSPAALNVSLSADACSMAASGWSLKP